MSEKKRHYDEPAIEVVALDGALVIVASDPESPEGPEEPVEVPTE